MARSALKSLAVASLLGWGLAAGLSAAALDTGAALQSTVVESGWRLDLPNKSPLLLPRLTLAGAPWYPVKDVFTYVGYTVLWRSSARSLDLSKPDGTKARLVLGEPYLFESVSRTALSQAPRLQGGTVALNEADLRLVLKHLAVQEPVWQIASEAELATVVNLYRGTAPAEPAMVPTQEPQVEATPVEDGSHVTAKVLTGSKLHTVVLDAGHGGYDPGAHGHNGLKEKDVCLDIVLKTRDELLRLAPDLNVVLTRSKDEFISLRERTDIANSPKVNADLFVSIHNNASPNRRSKGTQVFFYDNATSDRAAKDLVARENEDVNELDVLLTDLAKSLVRDQSIGLASRVQTDLSRTLGLKHRDLNFAPFYVLARTKMPAILIEVAFITHPEEERLLGDDDWQDKVADSIARGIVAYRKQIEAKP